MEIGRIVLEKARAQNLFKRKIITIGPQFFWFPKSLIVFEFKLAKIWSYKNYKIGRKSVPEVTTTKFLNHIKFKQCFIICENMVEIGQIVFEKLRAQNLEKRKEK